MQVCGLEQLKTKYSSAASKNSLNPLAGILFIDFLSKFSKLRSVI